MELDEYQTGLVVSCLKVGMEQMVDPYDCDTVQNMIIGLES